MTAVNLSSYPYYNDYDPDKGYHQIAFIPGRPIQARELTQMQSILQEQVKRVGNHFFKNGSVIIPGNTYYDNKVFAVRLSQTNTLGVQTDSFVLSLIGKRFKNASGTTAHISHAEVSLTTSTSFTPAILYVKFVDGGENGKLEFYSSDVLTDIDNDGISVSVTSTYIPTSPAAIVSISEGVYYANGYFIQVLSQSVALSSTTNKPTVQIGLNVVESIVTETDDNTLFDNSVGSSNFSAPGSHRLKIALSLDKRDSTVDYNNIDTADRIDFILLYAIADGTIQFEKGSDTEYARFEALLAKRTFEESGNYIVDQFDISTIDYRDNIRGDWTAQTAYLEGDVIKSNGKNYFCVNSGISGVSAPTHKVGSSSDGGVDWTFITSTSAFENAGRLKKDYQLGISNPIALEQKADDSFAVEVTNGVAYVNGFRTEIRGTKRKVVDKARTYSEEFNVQITAPNPITVYASNLVNGIEVEAVSGLPDISGLGLFNIYNQINGSGASIGTCRVKSVEGILKGIYDDEIFKVAIFDVVIFNPKLHGFVYNAVSIKSATLDCIINLSRRSIPLTGTHSSGIGADADKVYGILSNYDEEMLVGGYITSGNRTDVLYKVSAITSDVEISIQNINGAPAAPAWASGSSLSISSVAFKSGAISSITKLPNSNVRTLRSVDANGNNNTSYRVIKQITQSSSSGGSLIYTCPPGEKILSTGHLMCMTTTTNMVEVSDSWVSSDGTTLTVPNGTLANNTSYRMHLRISKSGIAAAERTKILRTKVVYVFSGGVYSDSGGTNLLSWVPNNNSNNGYGSKSFINLGYADIIRINSIRMSPTSTWQDTIDSIPIDVKSRYSFDNGQRAEVYDFCKIISNGTPATAPLEVSFDYFEHTAGDYFTVDSYQNTPYSLIPKVIINDIYYDLKDCVDFRIRVNDTAVNPAFFSVGNAMQTNEAFIFDYSYYLGRKDVLLVKNGGELIYKYGSPSVNPDFPKVEPMDGMPIAKIDVLPYTSNAEKEVFVTKIGAKNFTMNDLSKINERLKNVETYVQLSLLEKNTADYKITDKYGLDRLKNGFFVVDFSDNSVHFNSGAYQAPDYRCTIFANFNAMIPNRVALDCPVLIDNSGTFASSVGTSLSMSVYPNFITTLTPYQDMVAFSMKGIPTNTTPLFSTKVNVNPFNAFSYFGSVNVYPSVDTWQNSTISSETLYTDGKVISNDFNVASASLANTWVNNLSSNEWMTSNILNGTITNVSGKQTTTTNTTNMLNQQAFAWQPNILTTTSKSSRTSVDILSSQQILDAVRAGNVDTTTTASSRISNSTIDTINTTTHTQSSNSITGSLTGISRDNTTISESTFRSLGGGEDKFVRSRVFVVVAKGLIPTVSHKLFFDNVENGTEHFDIRPPIVFNIVTTSDLTSTLKFYNEFSVFSDTNSGDIATPNKISGMNRSFAEWSGNDYEGAINGKLVRFSNDLVFNSVFDPVWQRPTVNEALGLVAGWEKTSTGYKVYVFPTTPFHAAYNMSGEVRLDFLNEIQSKTQYKVNRELQVSASIIPGTWNFGSKYPKTTEGGNLFVLVKLQGGYFRTGEKQIVVDRDPLSSTPTVAPGNYLNSLNTDNTNIVFDNLDTSSSVTSTATCGYTATGSTINMMQTFIRRLNFDISANVDVTKQVDITKTTNVWYDPLAQSFMIKKTSSVDTDYVMVGGITCWFATVPTDTSHKLNIDIITTLNGYPTSSLVHPWAKLDLLPKDIVVASASNNYKGSFHKFPIPIPLRTNVEYAIRVVAATSNGFEMWTSQIGKTAVTGGVITAQEADGSLFMSQNGSTWTADQYSDLAATLHLYNYDSSGKSSTLKLRTDIGDGVPGYNGAVANMLYGCNDNTAIPEEFRTLAFHPFGCNGINNKIKVYHPRHLVFSNSKGKSYVQLVCPSDSTNDSITNVIKTKINGYYFKVENVKPSSYTLDLSVRYEYDKDAAALVVSSSPDLGTILTNSKKRWGSNLWLIKTAGKYDMIKLNADVLLQPNGTTVEFTKKLTYLDDNGIHIEPVFTKVIPKSDIIIDTQLVAFLPGELKTNILSGDSDYSLIADESEHGINFRCHASTSNKWSTPIIDLQSLSLTLGKSMQKPHDITDCVVDSTDFDDILLDDCIFSSSDNSVIIPTTSNLITSFAIGGVLQVKVNAIIKSISTASWSTGFATYTSAANGFLIGDSITISGINPTGYNGTYVITSVATDSFTVVMASNPGAYSSGGASGASRASVNDGIKTISDIDLVTRKIKINETFVNETATATLSMGLEYITEQNPIGGTSQSKFISREVILAAASTSLHITTAMTTPFGTGLELWYRAGMENLDTIPWIQKSFDIVQTNDSTQFYDNVIEINNIPEFTRFQCKFIFTSTSHFNSGIKDLRIVALL